MYSTCTYTYIVYPVAPPAYMRCILREYYAVCILKLLTRRQICIYTKAIPYDDCAKICIRTHIQIDIE